MARGLHCPPYCREHGRDLVGRPRERTKLIRREHFRHARRHDARRAIRTSVNRTDRESDGAINKRREHGRVHVADVLSRAGKPRGETDERNGEVGVNNTSIGPPSLIATPLTTNLDAGACQAGLPTTSAPPGDKIRLEAQTFMRSNPKVLFRGAATGGLDCQTMSGCGD